MSSQQALSVYPGTLVPLSHSLQPNNDYSLPETKHFPGSSCHLDQQWLFISRDHFPGSSCHLDQQWLFINFLKTNHFPGSSCHLDQQWLFINFLETNHFPGSSCHLVQQDCHRISIPRCHRINKSMYQKIKKLRGLTVIDYVISMTRDSTTQTSIANDTIIWLARRFYIRLIFTTLIYFK